MTPAAKWIGMNPEEDQGKPGGAFPPVRSAIVNSLICEVHPDKQWDVPTACGCGKVACEFSRHHQ